MKEIFGEVGILKQVHDRFDYRPEQVHMSDFILDALCERRVGLVEAGTGVGKTLAYLIPSIVYCMENNKRLAISTETKTLQKQLLDRELPLARKVLERNGGCAFTYSLCLGGSNYPCRRRFDMLLSQGRFTRRDIPAVERMTKQFESGTPFTIFDAGVGQSLWEQVAREADLCAHYGCRYNSSCAFQGARKEWAKSDVLVVNHSLFFANAAVGRTYLPPMDVVVFDEAHSLEDIAAEQFGFSISYTRLMEIIARFQRGKKRGSLLAHLSSEAVRKKGMSLSGRVSTEAGLFFEGLRGQFGAEKNSLRITDSLPAGKRLLGELEKFLDLLEEMDGLFADEMPAAEYAIARGRLFVLYENLRSVVHQEKEDHVCWLERSEDALLGDIQIKGQPVDVSEILRREVVHSCESTIYVSATLSVHGDFSFTAGRLGLEDYRSLCLQSPFDYVNQVVMLLASDVDEPSLPSFADHSSQIAAQIIDYLRGNCLVLFTSYRTLEEVKKRLSGLISFPIFSQGDFTAVEALQQYLGSGDAVLMGTHSFWQGIDLPGDLLRGVILMRLPFSVPDHPPVQARIDRLIRQGHNPFYHYQVPSAILRFKQGFGRLIRGTGDRGVVAVLDSRIVRKSYGRLFLQSLPECTIVRTVEEMKEACDSMFSAR